MKKATAILFLCIAASISYSQEILAPLSSAARRQAPKSSDTVVLELPFFDDFSDYEGLPSPKLWLSNQAFVNKDYAPKPPSVGMVTLDALDGNGDLYPHASTNLFAADTLTSQIIRLDSLTEGYQRQLAPADSICLSFFVLPGGWYGNQWELVGDAPSTEDSLFLEFFDGIDSQWNTVWATGGYYADTTGITSRWPWSFVCVKIDDPRYLTKNFQFRFRNYASLDKNPKSGIAGNCDQWNIDYVYLNRNRNMGDSLFRDVAFVEKAPSLLKNYQAMPARQFADSEMQQQLQISIVNRYNQTLASNYSYTVSKADGQQVSNYDGGFENIPSFFPNGSYQTMPLHASPAVNFSLPVASDMMNGTPVSYNVTHVVREGVSGDNHNSNDTIVFNQVFDNYYAYDDGIPENGYGLTAPGSKVWLACRYSLNTPDTLTAVDLYFNRTRNGENENIQFQLCVWNCENGRPSSIIYKDNNRFTPEFDGMNDFHRYPLSTALVVSDSIFVGFEQLSNDFINLGFDRSTDARQHTYYRTSGEWMQSILKGSVMLRPVFGETALSAIHDAHSTSALHVRLFPNPTDSQATISLQDAGGYEHISISIYDQQGRLVSTCHNSPSIHTEGLPCGVYIVRITDSLSGSSAIEKLIIKR